MTDIDTIEIRARMSRAHRMSASAPDTVTLYSEARDAIDVLTAERNAANATIERVRGIAGEHWDWKAGRVLADRLRAALAAPEAASAECCIECGADLRYPTAAHIVDCSDAPVSDAAKRDIADNGVPAPLDREHRALRRIWAALGCERNPDDFKTGARDSMWDQVETMVREHAAGTGRIIRELQADLAARPAPSVEELADWLERELWVETHSDLCGCRDIDTCDYAQRLRSSSASPEWYVLALQRRGALATRPAPLVEITDEMVEAAHDVFWGDTEIIGGHESFRAALTAALSPRVESTPDENGGE